MINEIRSYVNELFVQAPPTMQAIELRDEVTSNLIDKYTDLVKNGVSQEEAFRVVVASVGDVNGLIDGLTSENIFYDKPKSKKHGALTAVGVGTLVAGVAMPILADALLFSQELAVAIMFVIWGIAIGILVYANLTKPRYRKTGDNVVENFKEWNSEKKSDTTMKMAVSSALWLIITVVFVVLFFATGKPYLVWVVYLIAGAIQGFVNALFSGKDKR